MNQLNACGLPVKKELYRKGVTAKKLNTKQCIFYHKEGNHNGLH